MESSLLESGLIEHCAPTLAGMKSACLFNYFYRNKAVVLKEIRYVNEALNERGVYIDALLWRENSVLIYAYRLKHVQEELNQPGNF